MLTPKQRRHFTPEELAKLNSLLAVLTPEELRDLIDATDQIAKLPKKKRRELARRIAALCISRGA